MFVDFIFSAIKLLRLSLWLSIRPLERQARVMASKVHPAKHVSKSLPSGLSDIDSDGVFIFVRWAEGYPVIVVPLAVKVLHKIKCFLHQFAF